MHTRAGSSKCAQRVQPLCEGAHQAGGAPAFKSAARAPAPWRPQNASASVRRPLPAVPAVCRRCPQAWGKAGERAHPPCSGEPGGRAPGRPRLARPSPHTPGVSRGRRGRRPARRARCACRAARGGAGGAGGRHLVNLFLREHGAVLVPAAGPLLLLRACRGQSPRFASPQPPPHSGRSVAPSRALSSPVRSRVPWAAARVRPVCVAAKGRQTEEMKA